MEIKLRLTELEEAIIRNNNFVFTMLLYITILMIFINLSIARLQIIGIAASLIYFFINGIYLGHAFFEKEAAFIRLMLGILLLIMLLGFVGELAMIIYNLDVPMFTLVLLIAATLSSLINKRMKSKNAT